MVASNDITGFSHDMANMLSAASMLVGRLETAQPSDHGRLHVKLSEIMDACIDLCVQTMKENRPAQDPGGWNDLHLGEFLVSVSSHAQAIANRDVGLTIQCPVDLSVRLCGMRLYRVLFNLLVNAVEALEEPPRPRVWLSAERKGADVRITVQDNGPGFSKTRAARQDAKAMSERYHAGIGLPTAFALASEMGATLRLVDTSEAGTVFCLAIPNCIGTKRLALSENGSVRRNSVHLRRDDPCR